MKNLLLSISIISLFSVAECFGHENPLLGFKFTLPANWDSVAVLENNRPHSVFEAIREKSAEDFLTLVVYPTKNMSVAQERLAAWQQEMEKAFGSSFDKSKDAKVIKLPGGEWYSVVLFLKDGAKVFSYCINKNGYTYNLSFLNSKANQKQFQNEIQELLNSFVFETPKSFETVKANFNSLVKDSIRNFKTPNDFYFATAVNKKEICPYAYGLYSDLLNSKNTDCVLVSKEYFNQLFCLNIKFNMPPVTESVVTLISKIASNKAKQDGSLVEELLVGPWEESPGTFLQKYRLTKDDDQTTVYIFYHLTDDNKTTIIKVQLSTQLEKVFEDNIYGLILANI